jgi:YVTN family beta-propeller protein
LRTASGDGSRIYVGLENADALAAIDTATNTVIANIPIGQAPQAIAYVPNAAPNLDDRQNLQALGVAGQVAHLALGPKGGSKDGQAPTSVSLFDQGLIQVLQASITGLEPEQKYVLALGGSCRRRRHSATARRLDDQSGRIGHCQRDGPNPANRQRSRDLRAALSGHCPRRSEEIRPGGTGANPVMVG